MVAFRSTVLAQFEGRGDDPVTLEAAGTGKARARWQEAGVPRVIDIDAVDPDVVPLPPPQPSRWSAMPESFPTALFEAACATGRESGRFALSRVQLRGGRGQVIGTDGRQLLIRGGFSLPWPEDLLAPRRPALGLRELRDAGPVGVCRVGDHVALRLRGWSFFLAIDRTSRYPDVQAVLPRPSAFTCHVRLDEGDAAFLARALPGPPGGGDDQAPVTLDLGRQAVVRAIGGDDVPCTELELARSAVEGKPARICCDRRLIQGALALGFRELHVGAPNQPASWRHSSDDVYLFVPLNANAAVPPGKDAVRIDSVTCALRPNLEPHTEPERREETMTVPGGNGHATDGPPDRAAGIEELVAETEGPRRALQEAAARDGRLAAALRQQRRQSRAVLAAVEVLRGLRVGR